MRDASKFELTWITPEIHAQGVRRFKKAGSSGVSLVDAISFVVMRLRGLDTYLGYDRHFEEEGFRRVSR